jgi:hypothetical protein
MRSNNSFISHMLYFFTPGFFILAMTLLSALIGLSGTPAPLAMAAGAPFLAPVPFPGPEPKNIPAIIEAENFDRGGEGIGYHDLAGTTGSGLYRNRPVEGVDIQAFSGASGGFVVTEAAAGEWLSYTIFTAASGSYELSVRYVSEFRGGTFHIEIDGQNVTGAMNIMPTGVNFRSLFKRIDLAAGEHTLRLVMDDFDSIGFRALKNQLNGVARHESSLLPDFIRPRELRKTRELRSGHRAAAPSFSVASFAASFAPEIPAINIF